MVSHYPAKFDGHRHCGNGDMMFFVVEGQDSICPRFNPPLLFISKGYGLKAHGITITPILVTRAFASASRKGDKKEN